jgi:hypothetical protein
MVHGLGDPHRFLSAREHTIELAQLAHAPDEPGARQDRGHPDQAEASTEEVAL